MIISDWKNATNTEHFHVEETSLMPISGVEEFRKIIEYFKGNSQDLKRSYEQRQSSIHAK